MKTYKLSDSNVEAEQKTITITEEVTSTREDRTSVAQLKEQYTRILEQIEGLKKEADKIVDTLQGINDNVEIEITIAEIPTKLFVEEIVKEVLPVEKTVKTL